MKWLVNEFLAPLGRRVGGQAAAALVALGMAQQHESAVAAAVAWGVVTLGEVAVSSRSRKALVGRWGRN